MKEPNEVIIPTAIQEIKWVLIIIRDNKPYELNSTLVSHTL